MRRIGLIMACVLLAVSEALSVEIVVDYAEIVGLRAYPKCYLNNSILYAPLVTLPDRMIREYGKPEIV